MTYGMCMASLQALHFNQFGRASTIITLLKCLIALRVHQQPAFR